MSENLRFIIGIVAVSMTFTGGTIGSLTNRSSIADTNARIDVIASQAANRDLIIAEEKKTREKIIEALNGIERHMAADDARREAHPH